MQIFEKPWGREELLEHNSKYMFKKLIMKKGHRCSIQYHEQKIETVYVISGQLKLYSGNDKENLKVRILSEGDVVTIQPGLIHRMEAMDDCVYFEASTPELEDVIRLVDDYERV